MIVCEPTSGLTSRIYVIAEAYALARRLNQELIIVWQKTADCDCFYRDVFDEKQFSDIPHRIYECNRFEHRFHDLKTHLSFENAALAVKELWVRSVFFIRYHFLKRHLQSKCTLFKNSYEDQNALLKPEEAAGKSCYIEAYNCITGEHDLSSIRFQKRFLQAAEEVLPQNGVKYVGVHIRRTDHGPATAGSLTSSFIGRMQEILEADPGSMFYVATDDWSEQERLTELFGEHILYQKGKVLSRSSREGMDSAVIDMLCLSRTQYILGSYASIFSKFSAEYGGIRLEIV